ncbi:hypothetical protein ERJ75_001515000 [Trypanosoma vivax]|nr:hypothetical protein ERJ75_001515000 [Trypanosoma vivax]
MAKNTVSIPNGEKPGTWPAETTDEDNRQGGAQSEGVGILPAIEEKKTEDRDNTTQHLPGRTKPVHVRLVKENRFWSIIAEPEKQYGHTALALVNRVRYHIATPGGLQEDKAPRSKKVRNMLRAQRFSDFGYQV